MPPESSLNGSLIMRMPLPLAQLYRRAYNTRSPRERHNTAYYLWEAALKLLGSVAIVEYAELGQHNLELEERLKNLARPSLGHWWEFIRRLVPVLAEQGDRAFVNIRDLLLSRTRDDLPRTAGLYALMQEHLKGVTRARSTVRPTELFDLLVQYRNQEFGHGAAGQRTDAFYEKCGDTLLLAMEELLDRLDVLAGRHLLYVTDFKRQPNQHWIVERFELIGEALHRIEPLEVKDAQTLPFTEYTYLWSNNTNSNSPQRLVPIHPLLIYEAELAQCFFLNSRRGRKQAEYLCYATGQVVRREDLIGDQRQLLARMLGQSVDPETVDQWSERSQAEDPIVEPPSAKPSRSIGEFELLSCIGRGGMGIVYRAWQPSLGRQVALKCMLRSNDPKGEARFAREIRSLGRIDHPNLVKAYTSGSVGDQWFYAMELIEGADLATVCTCLSGRDAATVDGAEWQTVLSTAYQQQRNQEEVLADEYSPPPSARPPIWPTSGESNLNRDSHIGYAVKAIRQVANAAHALHREAIHRDIKPGNIMVSPDGEHAVLIDLGLAQLADELDGKLTRTRQFVGTLRYASPEQILAAGSLDARTDVYSLGATLWELLTLRPIYGATEAIPTHEIMLKIQSSDPDPIRRFNSNVPRDLEAIVLKCLEKDRNRRYSTAAELADELRRWQNGEPVHAHPPTFTYLLMRRLRRNRTAILQTTSFVLAGVVLIIAGLLRSAGSTLVTDLLLAFTGMALVASQVLLHRRVSERSTVPSSSIADVQPKVIDAKNESVDPKDTSEHVVQTSLTKEPIPQHGHSRDDPETSYFLRSIEVATAKCVVGNVAEGVAMLGHLWQATLGHEVRPSVERMLCAWINDLDIVLRHAGPISSVAISSRAKLMLTGSFDTTARLWTLRSSMGRAPGAPKGQPMKHSGKIYAARFQPNGELIATAGADGYVRLWSLEGDLMSELPHGTEVTVCEFSPDGNYLLTGGGSELALWNIAEDSPIFKKYQVISTLTIDFSPDGNLFLCGGADGALRIFQTATGGLVRALSLGHGDINVARFSPDGTFVVVGNDDGLVRQWAIEDGRQVGPDVVHSKPVYAIVFDTKRNRVISGSLDGRVRWFDSSRNLQCNVDSGLSNGITSIAVDDNGDVFCIGSIDGIVRIYNQSFDEPGNMLRHENVVNQVCAVPGESKFLTASFDGTARLITPRREDRYLLNRLTNEYAVVSFLISPCGDFAYCLSFHSLSKLDLLQFKEVWMVQTHGASQIALSGDGTSILCVSELLVEVYDTRAGALRRHWYESEAIRTTAFSHDAKQVTLVGKSGKVSVYSMESSETLSRFALMGTGTVIHIARGTDDTIFAIGTDRGEIILTDGWIPSSRIDGAHAKEVSAITMDKEKNLNCSGGVDGSIRLWGLQSGSTFGRVMRQDRQITSLAFNSHASLLASGSRDRTLRLWDTHTCMPIGPPLYHHRSVRQVGFDPRGRFAFSVSGHEVSFWQLPGELPESDDRIMDWVQVRTGKYADLHGDSEIGIEEWHKLWSNLTANGGPPQAFASHPWMDR